MAPLLALAAAVCWGVADFIGGTQARRATVLSVVLISQLTGLLLLGSIVVGRQVPVPPTDMLLAGLGTGVVGAFAFYGIYASLAMGNMARVAPIFGTASIIPLTAGLISGDQPSTAQLMGICFAVVGVILVSAEGTAEVEPSHSETRRALAVAMLTAICLGSSMIGVDYVADYDPYWATLLMRTMGALIMAATAVVLLARGRSPLALAGVALTPLILMGLLDTAANALWAIASTQGLLSVVAVLGSIFPAVTVLLALTILRDRIDWVQASGVVLTLLGTALITAD